MRILYKDLKKGELKIQIETLDDLWHLHNLIEPGDMVFAFTYRKDERDSDKLRPESGEKKRMRLGIKVEKTEFQNFSDRLRMHGVIEQAPENVTLGTHHTLNLSVGDDISIVKQWPECQLESIKEAIAATKKPLILMLSIDYGEAVFAILHYYGIEELARITANISGKQYKTRGDEKPDFYDAVLEKLKYLVKEKMPVIILGPGFAKEEFVMFGKSKNPEVFENCSIESASHSDIVGINEVLKKGTSATVLQESRIGQESSLIEKLLEEIAKDGLCTYGLNETLSALEQGAVETLLIIDILLREKKGSELLEQAKKTNASSMIISTAHDAGKKLKSLGGVGALLRYKIS